jgi:hypothetical protein
VLADHRDSTVVRDARVHDDAIADLEAVDPVPKGGYDSGPVCPENARLRCRREAFPHPDVEMVQAGCSQ